jgi:hypothetical protein
MARSDLTAQILRTMLDYEPDTGRLVWRADYAPSNRAGKEAGCIEKKDGYRVIFFGHYGLCAAGRLAWLHFYGEWPKNFVDHIDGDVLNNRIANLRDVSHTHNLQNQRRAKKQNKSGLLGVVTCKTGGFVGQIQVNKKRNYLGWFKTAEEAHEAYKQAKRRLHAACTI